MADQSLARRMEREARERREQEKKERQAREQAVLTAIREQQEAELKTKARAAFSGDDSAFEASWPAIREQLTLAKMQEKPDYSKYTKGF